MARPRALTKFVGVRCTDEEIAQLDDFRRSRGIENRSDAIRTLVREATARPPAAAPLPITQQRGVDQLIEDGYARSEAEALSELVNLGIRELRRIHVDDLDALHTAAQARKDRADARKSADREARDRLER